MVSVCYYVVLVGEMVDPLIAGLSYHATCQMKVLKYNLKNLIELADSSQNSCEKLKQSVIHHNNILR